MAAIEHNCECGENLWIITEHDDCMGCPDKVKDRCTYCKKMSIGVIKCNQVGCYLLTCKTCSAEDYIPRIG